MRIQVPSPVCPTCQRQVAILYSPDFDNLPNVEEEFDPKDESLYLALCECGTIWQYLLQKDVPNERGNVRTIWEPKV